ncbi:unnamed protein product [Rotaria socialis]|uniref:Transposase n=1 Tax=Rotaria socialis TaxID=392032 RepID=A0A817V359_9BILA|nr:unnamed protein product [Rotaria socialis]CAF3343837.1 unnamed protein product [Rotaria socialis]CAF3734194.1 unnamed protein product [Rotaria socialis]
MSRNTISDVVEGRILQLLHHGCSQCQIFKVLKSDGIDIARSTISNVKRKISQQRNAGTKIKLNRNRPLQTLSVVNQVIVKIDVEDPSTQRAIAKAVKVSQSTVSKIIKNAGFFLRKKRKAQKLAMANIELLSPESTSSLSSID